jgi:hypothetical protein
VVNANEEQDSFLSYKVYEAGEFTFSLQYFYDYYNETKSLARPQFIV